MIGDRTARKPNIRTAMRHLIGQVRAVMPFDKPEARSCRDDCRACSQRLLDYLEAELDGWERRLQDGEQPNLGDLDRLARTSRKIYRVLEEIGLVTGSETGLPRE